MNKGIGQLIIGVAFIGLGGMRIANNEGGLKLFGVLMVGVGIFAIGYGIKLLSAKPNNNMD